MKLYIHTLNLCIIASFLSGTFVFASNVPGAFGSKMGAERLCAKPIGCQLYKFCVERYNQEYNADVYVPEKDEVTDFDLQQELKELALLISFVDKKGDLIIPDINPKTNKLRLSLMQEGNECVDFKCAKAVIESYEQPNPVGKLGLIQEFDDKKKGYVLCSVCDTTNTSNIPKRK